AELGGEHYAGAAALDRAADQRLVLTFSISIGRIQHGDAGIERLVDQRDGGGVLGRAIHTGERHTAEPDRRDVDSTFAERALGQRLSHVILLGCEFGRTIDRPSAGRKNDSPPYFGPSPGMVPGGSA